MVTLFVLKRRGTRFALVLRGCLILMVTFAQKPRLERHRLEQACQRWLCALFNQ